MRRNSSRHINKDSKRWAHHIDPVCAHNLRARLVVQSRHMLLWVTNNIYLRRVHRRCRLTAHLKELSHLGIRYVCPANRGSCVMMHLTR